ncbi:MULTISPECIES: TonB-dependent receptor [unclassified Novosphingobium]|uniref:TonB-dependent receptor n=1 Tax=unclassified Novosphingobium TaxID=2644732 RepID=UPI000D31DAA3|nr:MULTISPECIES: TonB-dependent receptor [unclassified Novosphingobium]PTR05806.1 outer membrane receptor protein involved in Fe transport [Novosphingobium sp. GV055]PUA94364.1 outer membrane receptor protein involved in Fe transport [Novosphingobium sp. GV061]PUB12670.1 outer membrane receptor protein involved in Fe transport [Novosphingobium sp. GV079]PUB38035.1 outer membrane receptor protein involved in Fe transport [Novosphingobium sp. GV027]
MSFRHENGITFRVRLMAGAAATACLFAAAPIHAAEAKNAEVADSASMGTDAEQQTADQTTTAGPAEIVVTAQKRTESATKVPISISALSNESLRSSGVTAVVDLPHAVPAMRVNQAGTFVLPTIRGIGSMVALPGLTQNVSTYVDGFYVPSPAASNFDLINVDSVNVLKGPQGTLFGANAVGGAIVINTMRPKEEFSGMVRAGAGSYNDFNGALYVTGGLAKGITADIAGSVDHGDGWITNVVDGNDHIARYTKWSVRPQVQIEPTDGVKLLFSYAHDYASDPQSQMVVPMNGLSAAPYLNYAYGQTSSLAGTTLSYNSPDRVALDPKRPGYAKHKSDAWTFKGDFDLSFANLAVLSAYRKDSVDQAVNYTASYPIPIGQYRAWTDGSDTFTQEVNLTSKNGGRLNWVVGGFFMDYVNRYVYNTDIDAAGDMMNIFRSHNETQTYSAYVDATYEVIDHLFITWGGRYSQDHFKRDFTLNPALFGATNPYLQHSSPWDHFNNFSQRVVARYEITPKANIYASYSQGYRSGGISGSQWLGGDGTPNDTPVRPEHLDAYEVGLKTARGPLRLNVAGFFYDYRDIQVTSYSTSGSAVTVNAGRAHVYGLDGDLTYFVTPNLSVSLAGTLVNARYQNFGAYDAKGNCVSCAYEALYSATNPATIAANGGYAEGSLPATGNRVERTPPFSGSFDVNYTLDFLRGRLKLNANVFYSDSYYFDALQQLRNPSYTMLNLRATWTDPSGKFDVAVFGKNVNSAKYYIGIAADPSAARVTYGAPALFGGQVTYHFK